MISSVQTAASCLRLLLRGLPRKFCKTFYTSIKINR